jgi:hypothetical protein
MPGSFANVVTHAGGGDTIVFNQDCTGLNTISLAGTGVPFTVANSLTVDGSGHTVTITSNNGVFHVSSTGSLTLRNLSFQNVAGYFGTVENQGNLTVQNVTISGGTGNWSAAIANLNTATISGSTFINNSGNFSGAILALGPSTTITNSTFTGNHSTPNYGGTVFVFSFGPPTPVARIVSSTFYNNYDVALWNSGVLSIADTIVGGNVGRTCARYGSTTDDGYNLEDDNTDYCGFSAANHDIIGSPQLGSLASNGGPTQTFALPATSPAVGAGTCTSTDPAIAVPTVDQRGMTRPAVNCDIGAFDLTYALTVGLTPPTGLTSPTASAISNNGLALGTTRVAAPLTVPVSPATPLNLAGTPVFLATRTVPMTQFFAGASPALSAHLQQNTSTAAAYTTIELQLRIGHTNGQIMGAATYFRLASLWTAADTIIAAPVAMTQLKLNQVKQFACGVKAAIVAGTISPALAGTALNYAAEAYAKLGGAPADFSSCLA